VRNLDVDETRYTTLLSRIVAPTPRDAYGILRMLRERLQEEDVVFEWQPKHTLVVVSPACHANRDDFLNKADAVLLSAGVYEPVKAVDIKSANVFEFVGNLCGLSIFLFLGWLADEWLHHNLDVYGKYCGALAIVVFICGPIVVSFISMMPLRAQQRRIRQIEAPTSPECRAWAASVLARA